LSYGPYDGQIVVWFPVVPRDISLLQIFQTGRGATKNIIAEYSSGVKVAVA